MVPSSLKFLPAVVLGGGVQFLIYSFGGGGGGSGQPGNPMDTPLIHPSQLPCSTSKGMLNNSHIFWFILVYTGSCRLALSEIYSN